MRCKGQRWNIIDAVLPLVVCPDKEPGLQPWMPGHSEEHRVTIGYGRKVLLTTSATVHSIEILNGGKLEKSHLYLACRFFSIVYNMTYLLMTLNRWISDGLIGGQHLCQLKTLNCLLPMWTSSQGWQAKQLNSRCPCLQQGFLNSFPMHSQAKMVNMISLEGLNSWTLILKHFTGQKKNK